MTAGAGTPAGGASVIEAGDEPRYRRTTGLPGTLGVTLLGALLPGTGLLWTRRRLLGGAVLLAALALGAVAFWQVGRDLGAMVDFAFDPLRLKAAAAALTVALVLWAGVVVTTYLLVRPRRRGRLETVAGYAFVGVLVLAAAAPVGLSARYATVQADLVETVFEDNYSPTVPKDVTEKDPWGGRDRVSLLLLGGDGGVNRVGVRTDSMILVSMDTRTGETVLFSLPRNMMDAQFPVDSRLHELYPRGFAGEGDDAQYMLNAVYGQVPLLHPGVLGRSDNEGADALKQAVSGSLGLRVDYYLLVNLQGFREIVDAMGGVTVDINEPIAIGGNTDLGIPPDAYLQPGPDQRLDGFEALWYARGRYGSDDYERMERQRCMVDAIIGEAKPLTLVRRYQGLAAAGKRIVRTDVPRGLLPAFVDLAFAVKDASVRSVVFRSSEAFNPGDPDFRWLRGVVDDALEPPEPKQPKESRPRPRGDGTPAPGKAVEAVDSCGYDPSP